VFLSHDAFYHHQFITFFLVFVRSYYSMHCGSWHVERARDVFGAPFVKTLDYFHLLFRCNRFAFFSTIFFNNYEVRMLETKRRSTGESFTGETFWGYACTWSFVKTRYVMRGLKWAVFVTVKLQNLGEEPSSDSGSMTKSSWPMCTTHFGTKNELIWDVELRHPRCVGDNKKGYVEESNTTSKVVETKFIYAKTACFGLFTGPSSGRIHKIHRRLHL